LSELPPSGLQETLVTVPTITLESRVHVSAKD
jgi:hypothetical protein